MLVGLWLVPACSGSAGGAAGQGSVTHDPPEDLSKMTGRTKALVNPDNLRRPRLVTVYLCYLDEPSFGNT